MLIMPTQPAFQAFLLLLLSAVHAIAIPTYSGIRLPLVHIDYPRRHLQTGGGNSTSTYAIGDDHNGLYAVTISVGTPPHDQSLVMDTGVDEVWIQCQPCEHCYQQTYPVFEPSQSTSFAPVPCVVSDPAFPSDCDLLDKRGCDSNQYCTYEYTHEGSPPHISKGILATESILFGETNVPNFTIGCGRKNEGFTMIDSGILGLGGGSFAVRKLGRAFSYCLGSTYSPGSLEFGRNFPNDTTWVPLLSSIKYPTLYYVGLVGLLVGGEKVTTIPDDTFQIDPKTGEGGVIINSGVSVTYLPKHAYEPLRDMFVAKMDTTKLNITGPIKHGNSDACYSSNTGGVPEVPTVSFVFSTGLTLDLPSTNSLLHDPPGTYCFAFAPLFNTDYGMIGSIAQHGIQISIEEWNVGFKPDRC